MKSPLFSRTLALSGLTLLPLAWLLTGCGGGGGGSSNGNANATPTFVPTAVGGATATPAASRTPITTTSSTPLPTPTIPNGGQRIVSNISLGNGQSGTLNLVVTRFGIGVLNGLITVPDIPAEAVGIFAIAPGTYRVTGLYSAPNNFRLAGTLNSVYNVPFPISLVGKTALNGSPGTVTVTANGVTYPTQTF